ncbi:uncharacterized protein Z519_00946 [Cladophialophora bantiana CBS 173.52]|uniref:Ubiquitin-like protease family profile domain-containing protein n=1 Tax=Cladophialophora bantiana (strain ATCC 10958 / CBS 173.52 / CDC B-1940 / NIH 8579) TaxID=1442370 RepID=A0A0D2I0M8_CLAB1|nr:uncharacterized protein Z519_00946 [Cladophialophora bantiana CBS 173.52]KIW99283.1 hypothetical protein Z519_00946 [Cladophialophora bantiana CBS 173.52]
MTVPWREVVRSTLQNLSRDGLSSALKADKGQRDLDDNPNTASLVPPPSNASPSQSQGGLISRTSPRSLTKAVGVFLGMHDNAACAPIHIDGDDEVATTDEKRLTAKSGLPSTQYASKFPGKARPWTEQFTSRSSGPTLGQSTPWSEPRVEARIKGGLVRRDPGAVRIDDSMRKPFKTPTGSYRPYDTLTARSDFLQQRTSRARATVNTPSTKLLAKDDVHANDHSTPNKKRKIGGGRGFGSSAASTIPLQDSQNLNDSEDELGLNSKPADGKWCGKIQQPSNLNDTEGNCVRPLGSRNNAHHAQINQIDRSSPEDEFAFAKGSAQQRRAEKDKILESPSDSPKQASAQPRTSPYFTLPRTRTTESSGKKHNRRWDSTSESPDALQSAETLSTRAQRVLGSAAYPNMKTKDLGYLILGSNSSTVIDKQSSAHVKKPVNTKTTFALEELVYRGLLDTSGYIIELDRSTREVAINMKDPLLGDEPLSMPRGFNQIRKLELGDNQSSLVTLHFSRTVMASEKMYLRLASHEAAVDFVNFLQDTQKKLKVKTKDDHWMELAFEKAKSGVSEHKEGALIKIHRTMESSTEKSEPSNTTGPGISKKRVRLVDALDAPVEAPQHSTVTPAAGRRMAEPKMDATLQLAQDSASPEESTHPLVLPQEVSHPRADKEQSGGGQKQNESSPEPKASPTGTLVRRWTKDLVYPQPGRRAAVVPFEDLRRLNDDEFLNDNLISFFMRYLETHMEKSKPELHKRIHFFNTYFYEALSKTKGRKSGINYDAVSRWTKNINLFSRDFIVVPVNENFHWYLAIICNLPYFLGDRKAKTGWSEELQSSDQQSEEGERRVELPTDETQRTLADLSLSDDEENSQDRTTRRPGRRKLARRSLPKYEVTKPVIITLDSLGLSRAATCALLKQYVVLEARDKRNMNIDVSELRGMTAKEIPTQNNFSDCGLYLCVYLEQFVADPYNFIRRILQREGNAQQWPRRIHSEDLRSRLLELILEMHRRQEKQTSEMEEPSIGSILIDKREISRSPSLTQGSLTRQDIQEAQKRFEGVVRSHPSGSGEDFEHASPDAEVRTMKRKNTVAESSKTQDSVNEDGNGGSYEQMSPAPAVPTWDTRFPRKPRPEPSRLQAQVRATPPPRDVRPALNKNSVSPMTLMKQATEIDPENTGPHSNKRQKLKDEDNFDVRQRSRSPSRTSELTDYLSGAAGVRTYLYGIEQYAARDENREWTSPSPEPEVIAERKVVPNKETSLLGKRKKPGAKATAPNTASEYKEFVGLESRRGTPFSTASGEAGAGRARARMGRYDGGEDGEMLLKM